MANIQDKAEHFAEPDKLDKSRTIYDVSHKELVWRNFLAGMSRAVGMVVVQFLFFVVLAGLFAQFLLPQVMGMFGGYMEMMAKFQGGTNQTQFTFDSIKDLLPNQ